MIKGTEKTYDLELWKGRKLFSEVARKQGKTTERKPRSKRRIRFRLNGRASILKLNENQRKRLVFNSFLNARVPA